MEQLSGLDAAFVHQDTARSPMHICAVLIYKSGARGGQAITREELIAITAQRMAPFPVFYRKLRQVPMGLDTPYWVDVPRPQWEQHIRASSLPGSGDWAAFQQFLGRLHGARMDLARPLWELHLVHGLRGVAGLPRHCHVLVLKLHHSAIDGISMAAIINALHQHPGEEPGRKVPSSQAPSRWDLWARANRRGVLRQFKLAETVGNLLPGVLRAREHRRQFPDLPPVLRKGSRFNRPVHSGRSIGAVLLPRTDVLAVKRAVRRVTLNDIAMACVAGGLREYLRVHRQLPTKSLRAGVPINLREPGEPAGGNKTATMIVGLATQIADPVQRLRTVHEFAVAGKKQINALGSGTIMDISDSLTPNVLAEGIRTLAWASQVAELPVPFHTMISNVPGPAGPLYLGDSELVVAIGLGPVRDNMGLFHIVSGSQTMMSLSFSACSKLLPDAGFYQQCLQDSWEQLHRRASAA